MKRTAGWMLGLSGMLAMLALATLPARGQAEALLQPTPFLTPTPNAQGDIIYIVQDGDSVWRIAAIAGITVEQLQAQNGLQAGDFISVGMELLLGSIPPTAAPQATSTPQIEPSPEVGTGEICVLLFLDANGNARLDEGELPLADGQVSVADRSGQVAGDHATDDNPDGYCFTDLQDGDYNVSAAVPPEHNPTTSMNVPIQLNPGDIKYVQFGGQPSGAIVPAGGNDGGGSSLLGAVGVVLLGASGVLGYFALRGGRR